MVLPLEIKKIEKQALLRNEILSLTKEYVRKYGNINNKIDKSINVSGKVIDEDEVCNIVESAIARATHAGIYTHAGPEIGNQRYL